jgi:glycosyltransferase involved in cell wall biosynthesis
MKRPLLTVLTAPVPTAPRRLYQDLRRRVRPLVKPGAPLPAVSRYPGHYALVRSVVEGLRAIGADFNFNPRRLEEIGPITYAPENAALRQGAELTRRGTIDYLVAGPVNALFTDENDAVLLTPEIDRLIVASEWQLDFFRDAPQLAAKSRVCPCGVDSDYWAPSGRPRTSTAVVYWKSGDEAFCEQVEQIVRACGLQARRVRSRHGEHAHFSPDDYRRLLDEARVGVFLSTFETQGLALAEAWSMDVPTLVWNPRGLAEWRGRTFASGSSAPYLTPATGRSWRTLDELATVLRGALDDPSAFHPRTWVLSHMTDALCSAALYDIITNGRAEAQPAR